MSRKILCATVLAALAVFCFAEEVGPGTPEHPGEEEPTATPAPPVEECNTDDPPNAAYSAVCPPSAECNLSPRTSGCSVMTKGLAGGCTKHHCENTMESAKRGLNDGANVLEMDVCLSKDNVLFLWFDCDLHNALARARRLGQWLPGNCVPWLHPSVPHHGIASAREMTWADIQQKLGYSDDWCSSTKRDNARIPTLQEFLNQFGNHPRIKHLHLDVKVRQQHIPETTRRIYRLAKCLGVSEKIVFGYNTPQNAMLGQCALQQVGGDPRKISIDYDITLDNIEGGGHNITRALKEVERLKRIELAHRDVCRLETRKTLAGKFQKIFTAGLQQVLPLLSSPGDKNPINQIRPVAINRQLCAQYANIGVPQIAQGSQIAGAIIKRALETRASSDIFRDIFVTVYGTNDIKMIAKLYAMGIDGTAQAQVDEVINAKKLMEAGCLRGCRKPAPTPPAPQMPLPAPTEEAPEAGGVEG